MIKFCNETLAAFKNDRNRHDKFENKHILTAHVVDSDYLYRELEDEIYKHVPRYAEYIEILNNLESLYFTKEDFVEAREKCKALLDEKDKYEHVMRQLFDFSVIGYYIAGGREGGADYVWKYKDQRSKLNDNATQFRVHPGFKEVLGLKKFSRSE
jgi:hypothetical protein